MIAESPLLLILTPVFLHFQTPKIVSKNIHIPTRISKGLTGSKNAPNTINTLLIVILFIIIERTIYNNIVYMTKIVYIK